MKSSFGVASCARIRSARTPPARKKPTAVAMYMIPIRLWSTVVSQLVTRPAVQGAGCGSVSARAATRASSVGLVHVLVERRHLAVVPRLPDGRHLAAPVADDVLEPLAV